MNPQWQEFARWAGEVIGLGAKGLAIAVLIAMGLFGMAAALLWDVDHWAARAKWEDFKLAWFSQWPPKGGPAADGKMSGYTIFFERRFGAAAIVVGNAHDRTGRLQRSFCYAALDFKPGEVSGQVMLAQRAVAAPPTFAVLTQTQAQVFGLDAATLEQLARDHCRFDQTGAES